MLFASGNMSDRKEQQIFHKKKEIHTRLLKTYEERLGKVLTKFSLQVLQLYSGYFSGIGGNGFTGNMFNQSARMIAGLF